MAKTKEVSKQTIAWLDLPAAPRSVRGLVSLDKKHVGVDTCVYFLCKSRQIVYVGRTGNLFGRLAEHVRSKKDFDEIHYVKVPWERVSEVERAFIQTIRPVLNVSDLLTSKMSSAEARRIVEEFSYDSVAELLAIG